MTALLLCLSAALIVASLAQFPCPTGHSVKSGASCSGRVDATCSISTCCTTSNTRCSKTNVLSGNARCKKDGSSNNFFDLKKSWWAHSGTDGSFKSACCSPCSEALCADWATVKSVGCGNSKVFSPQTKLASNDCTIPGNDAYKSACCVARATCSNHGCPDGLTVKSGAASIYCSGSAAASCTHSQCCTSTSPWCSSVGIIAGPVACTIKPVHSFFDLKKLPSEVASGAAAFRSTCCSSCAAATCGDWQPAKPLVACDLGKLFVPTTTLASSDCTIPTNAAYKAACCVPINDKMCVGTDVITGNAKCKDGGATKFMDLKKTAALGSNSDSDFRSGCCTSCSEAKCADWQTVKFGVGCGSGKVFSPTTTLSSSDCSIPSNSVYKDKCCVAQAGKCAATDIITGNVNCKQDKLHNFYDLKKTSSVYTKDTTNDNFRSKCCSSCSQATCADWRTVKSVQCPSGKSFSNAIALGSADCTAPANDAYTSKCCVDARKCSAFVYVAPNQDVDAAFSLGVAGFAGLIVAVAVSLNSA